MEEQNVKSGYEDKISVGVEDAQSVTTTIRQSSGKMTLRGGAAVLCEGTLHYAGEMWKPEVTYEVDDTEGRLLITPPTYQVNDHPNPEYDWNLAFSDTIPLALRLQIGSGKTHLSLKDSLLQQLTAEIGSGPLDVNLLGTMPVLERVRLITGSGPITTALNGHYTNLKKVKLATGSGSMDVALGGNFPSLEEFTLAAASGEINVGLVGDYASLHHLKVDTASGKISVNLDNLAHDLAIAAHCVSGDFVISYPANIGIAVKVNTISGKFHAAGLTREHGEYVNPLYGQADVNVRISFSAVSGTLRMQPRDE